MFSLPAVRRNNPLKETWRSHGERTQSERTSELAQSKPSLICCNHTINIFSPTELWSPTALGTPATPPTASGLGYRCNPKWCTRCGPRGTSGPSPVGWVHFHTPEGALNATSARNTVFTCCSHEWFVNLIQLVFDPSVSGGAAVLAHGYIPAEISQKTAIPAAKAKQKISTEENQHWRKSPAPLIFLCLFCIFVCFLGLHLGCFHTSASLS